MDIPIVCFVGKSNSGKTTFLEKLIPELTARSYRIGLLKHDIHGFELDQPGKDSYRLRRAGAWRVAISSPEQFAVIGQVEGELPPEELAARYLGDVDIVLAEGYRRSHLPKIEVCRAERSRELLCAPEELLAVVSDLRFEVPGPQFDLDDTAGVAGLLEERFLHRPAPAPAVSLRVDGRAVPLKPFVQEMFAGVMRGLLAGLKEAQGRRIELDIGMGRENANREA
jgi:molybdopterin-guanine dinucleotide biosynthesis protein B